MGRLGGILLGRFSRLCDVGADRTNRLSDIKLRGVNRLLPVKLIVMLFWIQLISLLLL
jgi:hypothetical protein